MPDADYTMVKKMGNTGILNGANEERVNDNEKRNTYLSYFSWNYPVFPQKFREPIISDSIFSPNGVSR